MPLITKMLEIAINDADAGRITYDQLLSIFQDAINNGDILEEDNSFYVITGNVPLIDAGILQRSSYFDQFETLMNVRAIERVKTLRSKRWWQFWK